MHRSGTSALTRVLSLLGAALPKELLGPTEFNVTGHWESSHLYDLHNVILEKIDSHWEDWTPIDPVWFKSKTAENYATEIARYLIEDFSMESVFVIKDPRICRILELWRRAFAIADMEMRAVIPVRNPIEVIESLHRRQNTMMVERSLLIWLRYVLDAEFGTRNVSRVWVSYDQLLTDWRSCVRKINQTLKLHLPRLNAETVGKVESFINPELRHHAHDSDSLLLRNDIPKWVKDTYEVLIGLLNHSENHAGLVVLDSIRNDFDAVSIALESNVLNKISRINKRYINEIDQLRLQLNYSMVRISEVEYALLQKTEANTNLETLLSRQNDNLLDLDKRHGALLEYHNDIKQKADRLENILTEQRDTIKGQENQITDLLKQESDKKLIIRVLESHLSDKENIIKEQDEQIIDLEKTNYLHEKNYSEMQDILNSHQVANTELTDKLELRKRELIDLSQRLESIVHSYKYLRGKLQRLIAMIDTMITTKNKHAAKIEILRNALRNNRYGSNYRYVISRLMTGLKFESIRKVIVESNLFDKNWYISDNPDVQISGVDPIIHYLKKGENTGRKPNPLFDPVWYCLNNPDVVSAGISPLVHFIKYGAKEMRSPNIAFDTHWYSVECLGGTTTNINPLLHYIIQGANEGRKPHPYFDGKWYLDRYPDVKNAKMNPLVHYLVFGIHEGREPSTQFRDIYNQIRNSGIFDSEWYRKEVPEIDQINIDPVVHFILCGAKQRWSPSCIFNTDFYLEAYPDVNPKSVNPLLHYLNCGLFQARKPNLIFDPKWYLQAYPEIINIGLDPLVHYSEIGWREGKRPHPFFDNDAYLENHPELVDIGLSPLAHYLSIELPKGGYPSPEFEATIIKPIKESNLFDTEWYMKRFPNDQAAGIDPVLHYIFAGTYIGQSPHPLFDPEWYLKTYPQVDPRKIDPLLYFVTQGWRQWHSPHPLFDMQFYVQSHPDLLSAGINPAVHYLRHGWKPEYRPHQLFDTTKYLTLYPEIKEKKINPLLHYLRNNNRETWKSRLEFIKRTDGKKYTDALFHEYLQNKYSKNEKGIIFKYAPSWKYRIPILKALGEEPLNPESIPETIRDHCKKVLYENPLRISVVTPTWNRGLVLRHAVDSLLAQTYPVYEIVIVDDGSTDGTIEIVEEDYREAIDSGRVKLIKRQHEGLCATRNAGLEYATGDLLAYLDSDNHWHADFTLIMASVFAETPGLGTAYCGVHINDHDRNVVEELLNNYDRSNLLRRNYIDLNCFVHRRGIYAKQGGFDTSMTRLVDWEFIIRYTKLYPPALVPIYLVEYYLDRLKLNNVTYSENWRKNWEIVYLKHISERLRYGVDELKIGYVVWDWPALSQTFVINELRWLLNHRFDVKVYFKTAPDLAVNIDFLIDAKQVNSAEELATLLKDDSRNVLHSPFAYPATALLTWPAARIAGIPFTFMPAGVDISHASNRQRNQVSEVANDPNCLGVITLGSYHRELLASQGVPMRKMVMERQAVGLPDYQPQEITKLSSDRRKIISIGRFIEKKGLIYLIRAVAKMPKYEIIIYGYGPLEQEYRMEINRLGIKNISFGGTLDTVAALHEVYHLADIFVLPCVEAVNGDMDGLPTVILEAMAAGVPVVTTKLANIPDLIVHRFHGYLSSPADVESLVDGINWVSGLSNEERSRLLKRARKRAIEYASDERMMHTMLDIWRSRSIDIVLVTYDTPEYDDWEQTRDIIDRIYEHTVLPFNLIIVDNASQQTFRDALEKRYGSLPNFNLIKLDKNVYVGPGTNIGIDAGSSENIIYICSKEGFILQNGWDLRIVHEMDAHPNAAIGGYLISLPNYRNGKEYVAYPSFQEWRNKEFALNNPDRRFRHVQGGILAIRRSAYETVGGFSDAVPHNGTDIEYSYFLESHGFDLLDIPDIYSISINTAPGVGTLLDENALIMHPLTHKKAKEFSQVVNRELLFCNICEWQGKEFIQKAESIACPICGSSPFDRTVMRILSLSGVLQRRPKLLAITITDALVKANNLLCPNSEVIPAIDINNYIPAIDRKLTEPVNTIVIIDHLDIEESYSEVFVRKIIGFVNAGGRAIVGDGRRGPHISSDRNFGMVSRFKEHGVSMDEILCANNSLGFDTRMIGTAGFPQTRELDYLNNKGDGFSMSSGRLLAHQLN